MATYTYGNSDNHPLIDVYVTDNVTRTTGSAYAGNVTVTLGACSSPSSFGYSITCTVAGTTQTLKDSSQSTWSSGAFSKTYGVSGSSTASSVYVTVSMGGNAPRNRLVWSWDYEIDIGSYSPTPTDPASVPNCSSATAKLGTAITVYTNRQNSSYIHGLTYQVGSGTETAIAFNVTKSKTWTPPTTLIDSVSSAGTTCTIRCYTYYNGSPVTGSPCSATITLYPPDDAIPTVDSGWFSVTRENVTSAEGIAEWISGYSKAVVTFDSNKVHPKYSATIAGYSVIYNGVPVSSSPYKTPVLTGTSPTITLRVTDSRGFSKDEDYPITMLDYAPPTITSTDIYRGNSLKQRDDSGHYLCAKGTAGCTSLNGNNTVSLTGNYKVESSASWGQEVPMTNDVVEFINSSVVSETTRYVVRLTATDSLGNTTTFASAIPTKAITFHMKNGGDGAAFGGYSNETNTLELSTGWKLKMGATTLTEAQLQALLNLLS